MKIEIRETIELGPQEIDTVLNLMSQIFGESNEARFRSTVSAYSQFHLALAYRDGVLSGFKLGRRANPDTFYSWLGGVIPQMRGSGLAKAMMKHQHDWCRRQGYRKVQTKTQNHFKEMLIFNIKSGFQIIGTEVCPERGLKIGMEKTLTE